MKKVLALVFAVLICFEIQLFAEVTTEQNKDYYVNHPSSKIYLYNLIRYLYRWYLDEIDIEKNAEAKKVVCYIRELNPKLDEGDHSKYAEVFIPMFDITVRLKKSDYEIEEINQIVKSRGYKIVNVSRVRLEGFKPKNYKKVVIDTEKLTEYLFKTRNMEEFPDDELIRRIHKAMKNQVSNLRKNDIKDTISNEDEEKNVINIAPLSPIGNDIWAYWESGRIVIHCSSDIDISNKAVWEYEELFFRFYDVFNNTVVSLSEAALGNEYLTRDQVGRILFNCMVLGKRVKINFDSEEE